MDTPLFDRSVILRTAHANARKRMAPSDTFRNEDRRNAEAGGYAPKFGYREAFRRALKWAWRDAKVIAEDQAWEAAQPKLPQDVVDRVSAMRSDAWFEPITRSGNQRYREILAEASEIEEAARAAAHLVVWEAPRRAA